MSRLRTLAAAVLVLSVAGLFPGLAEAALNAYISRRLVPLQPKAGETVIYIGTDRILGVPTGRRDGVIAVSHDALDKILDELKLKGQFRSAQIYTILTDTGKLAAAGLTQASLSQPHRAVITFGSPSPADPDRVSATIEIDATSLR
jgi:hypothetical protein